MNRAAEAERPLHIMIFLHSFEPGGVERTALRLAGAWSAASCQVTVAMGRAGGALMHEAPSGPEFVFARPFRWAAMATIVRYTRAGMLDTLNKPFVQYERAMGLPESLIVWKYMLRNALTSTVTQIGLVAGALLGGAVVIEAVFDWPGLGYYAVNSIVMSDYNAVLGFTVWVAIIYIAINAMVDVVHRLIDPRSVG